MKEHTHVTKGVTPLTRCSQIPSSLRAGREADFQKRISSSFWRWEGSILLATTLDAVKGGDFPCAFLLP